MRNITRNLLSSACTITLVANGFIGVVAQDKKQERSTQSIERQTFIFQSGDGQEPRLRVPDPTADGFRTLEGFNGVWVNSGPQVGGDYFFQYFTQEMSFDTRLVKDSPFSADIVTESVQTLADGNRILQRSEGRVYRDSQGRTRNEKTFKMGGSNIERQMINIFDPVGNTMFTLDPQTKTARKMNTFSRIAPPPPIVSSPGTSEVAKNLTVSSAGLQGSALKRVQPSYPSIAKAARASGPVKVQITIDETGNVVEASAGSGHPLLRDAAIEAARQWQFKPTEVSGKPVKVQGILTFNFTLSDEGPTSPAMIHPGNSYMKMNANTEQLGKQMIEGVECEGTRLVTTLPAGAIGNENPIQTVRESWYSPELKTTILTKQKDPRFGESTYRVTNIVRAEPDATLFQIPNDYTVKEGGGFSYRTGPDGSFGVSGGASIEIREKKP